jgi:NTE family protein
MIKKRNDYAAWLTLKYNFRDTYLKNLPTNVINSVPIDYYLMETFSGVASHFRNNFDSLFVPFRCVAADIENKKSVIFKGGDLPSALRSSMSYPFYLRPISIDGHLLFDGGLYNNFPTDVMLRDFSPDFIIGSNVAEPNAVPDDENLYLQLRTLLMSQTNFKPVCDNGVIIEPWSDVGAFNFNNAQRLIDSGYAATVRLMPEIKRQVQLRSNPEQLAEKRQRFKSYQKNSEILIEDVTVEGFNAKQTRFITKSIFYDRKPFTMDQLRKRYFRLASEDKIKNIFPVLKIDSTGKHYTLKLN